MPDTHGIRSHPRWASLLQAMCGTRGTGVSSPGTLPGRTPWKGPLVQPSTQEVSLQSGRDKGGKREARVTQVKPEGRKCRQRSE